MDAVRIISCLQKKRLKHSVFRFVKKYEELDSLNKKNVFEETAECLRKDGIEMLTKKQRNQVSFNSIVSV